MMEKKQKTLETLSRGTSLSLGKSRKASVPQETTGGFLESAGREGEECSQLKMEGVRKLPRDRDERH